MIGERIGNFQIVNQIGAGGMGEVFLGIHDTIGTKVAIKMLQPHISANKEYVQRFFNEAIAAAKIQHAGIGKIFDVGFDPRGRAYLVMEFLDGETLAQRIRRLGRLPLAQIGDIGKQLSSVLEAVHNAGITHRDLKPDNVFLVGDSELASGERVKVLDFGIAKLSGHNMALTATAAGTMGTPAYMSPEQWKNSKNVDWRADAYSLGCLVFEMVAGRPPFFAETIGEACAKHLSEEPPRLSSLVATPVALDMLVAGLLAKNPDERPRSMRDIGNQFAGLAVTPPPSASIESAMVPRAAQVSQPPASTTLGAAAVSMPAARRSNKKLMIALIASGAAIAAVVVAVLASPTSEPRVEPATVAAPADPKPAPPEELAAPPPAAVVSENPPLPANPPPEPAVEAPAKAAQVAGKPPVKPAARGCDEVSCILNNHEGACCAKFGKGKPRPSPASDLPEKIDRAMISAGFAAVKARASACGDKVSAKGQVKVSVKVDPDGSVASVRVTMTPDPVLGSCVANAVQKARFRRTQQGGSFSYPFTF